MIKMADHLRSKKGTCAQFLRENPRFLNEPICRVAPSECSRDVNDCITWHASTDQVKARTK